MRVANLKTSRPFILTYRSGWSNSREPLPGSHRLAPPPPSALRERVPARGKSEVGERLIRSGHPPLADPGALKDPLVGGVDVARELLVRDDAVGDPAPEAGDGDVAPVGRSADHSPTKTVSVA